MTRSRQIAGLQRLNVCDDVICFLFLCEILSCRRNGRDNRYDSMHVEIHKFLRIDGGWRIRYRKGNCVKSLNRFPLTMEDIRTSRLFAFMPHFAKLCSLSLFLSFFLFFFLYFFLSLSLSYSPFIAKAIIAQGQKINWRRTTWYEERRNSMNRSNI